MSVSPIDPVKLEKLAEVAVKVGLQLQKDQDLVITAPLAALPLVRWAAQPPPRAHRPIICAV